MTQQFKVGDRVRLTSVHVSWNRDKIGAKGIITSLLREGNGDYLRICLNGEEFYRTILIERLVYASVFYAETDRKGLVI